MEGLSTICAGLGIIDEDDDGNRIGYSPGEYCLDNLKDLMRFLRRDDPQTREVFKQVCKWNIVGKDLIPIIEHCQDDRNLVLNSVKVLVFLTMPVEPTSNDIPQQLEYLWGLKSSITCSDTVAVIVSLLEIPLENLESEAFTEDDWKLVQLVLTLFRNILAVQGISVQQKSGGSASQFLFVRDRFLELLFQENVMDLILVLTQHVGGPCGYFRQDNLLLLETFHYLFKGQEPELIATQNVKNSQVDGGAEATLSSLRSIMEEEEEKRRLTRLRNLGSFSQFSGTFTRLTMDGSKTLFKGNPCSASRDTLLKTHKNHRGPVKRMVWDHGRLPSTKDNILELLHDFVNQFLSGGYNVLMQSVREDIEKEHHAIQKSDAVMFFQVAQFVTSFQYHKFSVLKPDIEGNTSEASTNHHGDTTLFKGSICGPIAESMNESMFLLVSLKWRNAFDGLKETNDHKFLSAAGSLMRIMIRMLDLVLKRSPEDSVEPQTARILLYKLFYDQTDQGITQFILNLIKSFDTHKQARSDLADLVETIHVVVRLMENLQARGTLRVSKKSRKKRTKKKLNDEKDKANETVGDHVSAQNEFGTSACEQTTHLGNSEREVSTIPSSDGKEDDIRIPLQVDEKDAPELEAENPGSNMPEMESKKTDNGIEDYVTDDSSDGEQVPLIDEVDFKVSTLVSALANTTIIQNVCWLLKFYKSNTTSTNHYIICMLRRICEDLELSPMLYQLSLLTTFHDILVEQKSSPCKEYENIVVFLTSLVRRMLRKMKTHPLLFVEVLFWKTRKECHYINCEHMLDDLANWKKDKWGSIPMNREVGSSGGNGWSRRSIADALGDDEADFMLSQVIDDQNVEDPCEPKVKTVLKRSNGHFVEAKESITSTSNGGINRMENSDDKGHSVEHEPGRVHKRIKPLGLNDELEKKIKDLYEKYKDEQNCNRLIAEGLDLDVNISSRQVSKKLKQMGFKFPRKRRLVGTGGSNQLGEDVRVSGSEVTHPNSHDLQENSSMRRPLHSRKSVCAFSEEQELMIKGLFEQFKDHKRCSFMIAKTLNADGTFTAAQVSRKLKQIGLRIPQQKKDAHLHLRDEDLNDFSAEGADNSDHETLLSLRKRSKTKQSTSDMAERPNQKTSGRFSQEDSDDELLSSLVGSKTKQNTSDMAERPNEKTSRRFSQEDSDDDELLSSHMGSKTKQSTSDMAERPNDEKTSRRFSQEDSDDELLSSRMESKTKQSTSDMAERPNDKKTSRRFSQEDSDDELLSSRMEHKHEQPTEMVDAENDDAEAEAIGVSGKHVAFPTTDRADQLQYQDLHDKLADELSDFRDDVTPVASTKDVLPRRKLRMIIDGDDD